MSSPQLEKGYLKIANELVGAFCRHFPGRSEGQILFYILRRTYGWNKKEDKISINQIVEATGLSRRMVIYALQNLEAKKMIVIKRKRGRGNKNEINTIHFQKNYELWVVQEKSQQYDKVLKQRKEHYKKSKQKVVQEIEGSARNGKVVVQEIADNNSEALKQQGSRSKKIKNNASRGVVQEIEKNVRFLAPTKNNIKDNNNINNIYRRIFEIWNSLKIIEHKYPPPNSGRTTFKGAVDKLIKAGESESDILQTIKNYGRILKGDEYFWTYVWTLTDFLVRGYWKFKDWSVCVKNYRVKAGNNLTDEERKNILHNRKVLEANGIDPDQYEHLRITW